MLYRIENTHEEDVGLLAQSIVGQEERMRKEIQQAVHKFSDQFERIKGGDVQFEKNGPINQDIVTLACFCAYARCPVDHDRYSQAIQYLPQPEGPARLVKQFMQVGIALALVQGKRMLDVSTYEILKKVDRDLASAQRLSILKHLWDENIFEYMKQWKAMKEISDAINMPATTVKLLLEDLMIVGLLNRKRSEDGETAPYQWQWSQKGYDMAAGAKVFEVSTDEPERRPRRCVTVFSRNLWKRVFSRVMPLLLMVRSSMFSVIERSRLPRNMPARTDWEKLGNLVKTSQPSKGPEIQRKTSAGKE